MSFPSMRRVLVALLTTTCAAGLLAAAAGPALARNKPPHLRPVVSGSRYLALGDSVSFGYRESTVQPQPDYSNASNFLGFPEHIAAALHLKLANAACSGETTASLIDKNAQSNGCENLPSASGPQPGGYRSQFPLHVSYSGSQLQFAVSYLKHNRGTRLVSLMIGANDFFVCQETTADHCTSTSEQVAVLNTIGQNVKKILTAIRKQAAYKGQIVIVNYYSLNYSDPQQNLLANALNATIDKAAKPFRVEIADGFGELQAAATDFGGNTCGAGLLTQLHGAATPCGVHPSYAGQALLAEAVERAIRT